MDPVVENRIIGSLFQELRTKSIGDFRIILCDSPGRIFPCQKCVTNNEVETSFGILPHHLFEIRCGNLFGKFIMDIQLFSYLQTSLMNSPIPGFFNSCLEDSRHFEGFILSFLSAAGKYHRNGE